MLNPQPDLAARWGCDLDLRSGFKRFHNRLGFLQTHHNPFVGHNAASDRQPPTFGRHAVPDHPRKPAQRVGDARRVGVLGAGGFFGG